MFGIFGILRKSIKAAILGGVQDAFDEMATATDAETPAVTLRLTFKPDEKDETPPTKRRKAE